MHGFTWLRYLDLARGLDPWDFYTTRVHSPIKVRRYRFSGKYRRRRKRRRTP